MTQNQANDKTELIGFWLVPETQARAKFQSEIDNLSVANKTASFTPHITLFTTVKFSAKKSEALVEDLKNDLATVILEPRSIKCSEIFTKSLIVDFKFNHQLEVMHNCFRIKFEDLDHKIYPHLSLLYSNQNITQKTKIKQELLFKNILPDSIKFDTLQMIKAYLPVETSEDVLSWEVLKEDKLINTHHLKLNI